MISGVEAEAMKVEGWTMTEVYVQICADYHRDLRLVFIHLSRKFIKRSCFSTINIMKHYCTMILVEILSVIQNTSRLPISVYMRSFHTKLLIMKTHMNEQIRIHTDTDPRNQVCCTIMWLVGFVTKVL